MPRPLPEYVRSPVREIMLNKYPGGGLKSLSENIGCSLGGVIHVLKDGKNESLWAYLDLAEQLKICPDRLAKIYSIDASNRREWLLKLLKHSGDINSLQIDSKARSYLYSVLSGKSSTAIERIYKTMASDFGMTLLELAAYLRNGQM